MVALEEMEGRSLTGVEDFIDVFPRVLDAAGVVVTDPEAFYTEVWLSVRTFPETVALVRSLREAGLGVHLATNQHTRRAAYMKQVLGYDQLFDTSFYSCELGAAKPEPEFFRRVLVQLGDPPPEQVVFVDDSRRNVESAAGLGLRALQWHLDEGTAVLRARLAAVGLVH